ncbi:uncharacterized protein F5147DRAFT_647723 [Suillus discolor]|uniref:C2H2-type domain-containing protein n=1 Tax=Suillus discolor TaxID=1912936 RepID=A0A9P7K0L3_9AGAM|nr:uncharacterized protein F5147DRAFT_647723 [Suillus discolor]KAG2119855.1 hypothetical protein F5147DRAFT_647723 [Suillus discolor]
MHSAHRSRHALTWSVGLKLTLLQPEAPLTNPFNRASDPKMDASLSACESSSSVNVAGYSTASGCQCTCGRSFAQLNVYANHQRTCRKQKKYLSNALAKAKEVWTTRKKLCREGEQDGLAAPPIIDHNVETWTSRAGESGVHPQLGHIFSGSKFTSDQTTFNGEEYSSALPGSGIEIESNDGCRPPESLHAVDDPQSLAEHRPQCLNCRLPTQVLRYPLSTSTLIPG